MSDAPRLPAGFREERLADEVRVARTFERSPSITLEEAAQASGLAPAAARAILREFTRAGLVTTVVANSSACQTRKGGPQFVYTRLPSFNAAVAEAAAALAARTG